MLFLKNLLLRNFQGCCLLFNYQGSSLFLLIRSSFDILSRRFLFVKNFFIFFLLSVPEVFLPHKSALIGYHIHFLLSRTFLFFFPEFSMCTFSFSKVTEKEGIWTLAPLLTTYSLSREPLQPAWVLLQMPEYFFLYKIHHSPASRLQKQITVFCKRRGWDSNPRALSDKRFSRPPRYDHFDTSPYLQQWKSAYWTSPVQRTLWYHMYISYVKTLFYYFTDFFCFFP